MGRIADYSNTKKYSDKKSFDGKPVEEGKVLVPFKKEDMNLMPGEYIDDNFTTFHLGEFKVVVGFMAISEGYFASYMQEFWDKLNKELEARREGRCVIGKNADGTDKLCPYTRKCKGCPNKGLLERRNTHRVEIISLDYEYDGDGFDIEDTSTPSVEDQVLEKIDPEPTEDELKLQMLAHFDKTNPRYGQIIRLSLSGMSIDDICITIGLKASRGRQEINNAHDAVCDYLKLRHHKKNRKQYQESGNTTSVLPLSFLMSMNRSSAIQLKLIVRFDILYCFS